MTVDPRTAIPDWGHRIALVTGLLLAPFAAMLHLGIGYADVARACRQASELRLHLESLGLLAIALGGTAVAGRIWRHAGRDVQDRFLGAVGLGLGLVFALVIIAQWLPVFQLEPCQ